MRQRQTRPVPATVEPGSGAAHAAPSVLQLQRAAGNRATSALIARVPKGAAKAGSAARRIVLDANVFDQIARGNVAAATTLRELARKHEVYVSWQALNEWVIRTADRKQSNTVQRVIDSLGLKTAPPAPAAVFNDVTARNTFRKGQGTATVLSRETDLRVAADAKALDAEVWSFDRGFRKNAGSVQQRLGVKVAAESQSVDLVRGNPKPKQSRALRLLGIKEDPVAGYLPPGKDVPTRGGAGGGGAATKEAVVKEAEGAGAKTAEKVAVKETGGTAGKVAAKSGKLAAKIGRAVVEGLVPDPLDAIGLMVDFAGSYAEAWDNIKRSNRTSGFAMGMAAYLVVPRWEWAKQFAFTTVSRGVITELLGAAGIAENAFNDGLVRGYLYAEKHSDEQIAKVRQKAFNTLRLLDRTPGYEVADEEDGEVRQFGRDDVFAFASVLLPTANAVLVDAERRREARIAAQKAREDIERWKRPPTVGYKL